MPYLAETLRKYPRAVKKLLIERAHRRDALAREFASLHSYDIKASQRSEATARKRKRDDVAANPGQPADHHLRTNPAELMHCGKTTDENKIADLALPA